MKNELRILELLAEYLKKTDQSLAQLRKGGARQLKLEIKHAKLEEKHVKLEEQHLKLEASIHASIKELKKDNAEFMVAFKKENAEFRAIQKRDSDEFRKECARLSRESRGHEIQRKVLLNEIFSISKRVWTLEEKSLLK